MPRERANPTTLTAPTLVALVQPRSTALSEHLPHALAGTPTAVHQARVASRRLREVLPLVRGAVGARRLEAALRHVRRVTRSFGPIRELDVALELLDDFSRTNQPLDRAIQAVRRDVTAVRRQRRAEMLDALGASEIEETRRAVEKVVAALQKYSDDRRWYDVLRARG